MAPCDSARRAMHTDALGLPSVDCGGRAPLPPPPTARVAMSSAQFYTISGPPRSPSSEDFSRALQPWNVRGSSSPRSVRSVPPSWFSSLSDDDGGHDIRAAASSVVELRNQSSSSVASTHREHCRQAISELRFARLRVNTLLARSFQCMVLTNVAPFWYTALHCDVPAVHGGWSPQCCALTCFPY